MDIEDAGSAAGNKNTAQGKLDQFRDFVGKTCCSCVTKMPAILLVIGICVLVALLLAMIPAIFVLTNAVSSQTEALVSSHEDSGLKRILPISLKPDNDTDDVELPPTVHGIPVTSLYPPNISMCFGFGFTCLENPSIVISTSKRCDGVNDCPDGSDERACQKCQTWASCPLTNGEIMCLHGEHMCDQIKHCPDQYDEDNFCKSDCDEGQHRCKKQNDQNICLPQEALCDGINDCADGSDESECNTCSVGAKFCAESDTCIAARNVCDGVPDCDDGSDEQGCDCRSCSASHLAVCDCGTCITEDRICDGVVDCKDGHDEMNCPGFCALDGAPVDLDSSGSGGSFCCSKDGSCHEASARCDGVAHCSDGEDEIGCTCQECLGRHEGVYMCGDGSRCLRRDDVCLPYSSCPNATFADKAYCAIQALRSLQDLQDDF